MIPFLFFHTGYIVLFPRRHQLQHVDAREVERRRRAAKKITREHKRHVQKAERIPA